METTASFHPARPSHAAHPRTTCSHLMSFCVLLFFVLGQSGKLSSQMNQWAMPPHSLNMTTSAAGVNFLSSNTAPVNYNVANGAYPNGSLLFYVKDKSVFNSSGTFVKNLGIPTSAGSIGGEIVILPMPGDCNEYFVIYSYYSTGGPQVLCTKVKNNNGTIQVDQGNSYTSPVVGTGYVIGDATSGFNGEGTGLAASKLHPDPNGNGFVYYLYMVNGGKVYYSTIGTPGIGTANSLYSLSSTFSSVHSSTELELSENEQYLAFNGIDPGTNILWNSDGVEVIQLTNPTTALPFFNHNFGDNYVITGIELVGSNVPVLYTVGRAGNQTGVPLSLFRAIDLTNIINGWWPVHPPTSGGTPFDYPYQVMNSQLEYSKSGKLCYICDYNGKRYFVEYDPASTYNNPIAPVVTLIDGSGPGPNPPVINSQAGGLQIHQAYVGSPTQGVGGIYTLPDQVDGRDYSNPSVSISGLTINGFNTAATGCDGNFLEVYNCSGIDLEATFEGGIPCLVRLEILPVTAGCGTPSGGNHMNYLSDISSQVYAGGQINTMDLRELEDANFHSLNNSPGYYVVTLTIKDCCGTESVKYFPIHVLEGVNRYPTMKLYDKDPPNGLTLPISHNINSPVNVGAVSVEFHLPTNLGSVTQLIARVEEVNPLTGTPINTIIDDQLFYSNPTNGPVTVNLNNLCADDQFFQVSGGLSCSNVNYSVGRKSFFSLNGPFILNKRYKLSVGIYNQCSSGNVWSYIEVVDANSRPLSVDQAESTLSSVQVYPNPTSGDLKLKLTARGGNYAFSLSDLSGRVVKTQQIALDGAGQQEVDLDLSGLENGAYLWQLGLGKETKQGKVTVLK